MIMLSLFIHHYTDQNYYYVVLLLLLMKCPSCPLVALVRSTSIVEEQVSAPFMIELHDQLECHLAKTLW